MHFSSGDSNDSGAPLLVQIFTNTVCRLLFIAGKNAELMVLTVLKKKKRFVAENRVFQIVLLCFLYLFWFSWN